MLLQARDLPVGGLRRRDLIGTWCAPRCEPPVPSLRQVKKSYQDKRVRRHAKGEARSWKLQRLAMQEGGGAEKASAQRARQAADRDTADMEHFLQVALHPRPRPRLSTGPARSVPDCAVYPLNRKHDSTQ